MGCKAAVQALQKADFLKAKVTRKCDLLNDSQAWTDQQQLQTIYHQVLVLDLEYALDKKVEQELWTVGFKNHITVLQEQARDKKNTHRSESQALLSWCLEAASGFYLTLLQELCSTFNLDLPFCKHINAYGQSKLSPCSQQLNPPQASSCIYICQYCLVHLGDIARYRNQRKQAESFYKHAILLSPTSGQPYNQLALLEASQGDKLAAIFYYVRGIAVKNPFPATATNLANTLSSAIDKDDVIVEVQSKLTVNEFIRIFIQVHGLLYTATDLNQADLGVKTLNGTLTPLVATQSFTEQKLIQMTVINLYALKHTVGIGTLKTEELTEDESKVRKLVLDLLAGSLSAFLLPVYTLNHDSTVLDYYALSAIKLILNWIKKEPEVLQETVFQNRLQIWPGLCKLLNNLQNHLNDFDYNVKIPLSEDRDLQGFLPLVDSFKELDFKTEEIDDDDETEKLIRAKRLMEFGLWLTELDVNNTKVIIIGDNASDKTAINFEPGSVQPDPTIKLLEEMKSFNIIETVQVQKQKGMGISKLSNILGPEKRGGILKPQGSLEKSRKEQETNNIGDNMSRLLSNNSGTSLKSDANKLKRVSQNVALQSIFKKMEENKQVKFDMGTVEKEKSSKLETTTNIKIMSSPYMNQPYHANVTYNKNLNTLSNDVHQDYMKSAFSKQGSTSYDRSALQNMPFPKTDLPSGSDLNKMPQNLAFSLPPLQHVFNTPPSLPNVNQQSSNFGVLHQRQQINQPLSLPYQNVTPFSQSQEYNAWKSEDLTPSNWWSNSKSAVGPNYPQRDFSVNYPYQNNMPYVHTNMDFSKPQINQPTNSNSPWSSYPNNGASSQSTLNYDQSNQGLSLRQAMLKESKTVPPLQSLNLNRDNAEAMMQVPSSTPGYSLFNSSSWSPSLPGQFRCTENSSEGMMHNLRQQSLLSRQAPLQQLLERQNQIKKGDS